MSGSSVRRAASTQLAEPAPTMTTSCTRPAYDRGWARPRWRSSGSRPLRDGLVDAIVRGEKTATTGLLEAYRREGHRWKRSAAARSSWTRRGGASVIETTEVEVKRMGEVDVALAQDEGEGFETVEEARGARPVLHEPRDGRRARASRGRDRRRHPRRVQSLQGRRADRADPCAGTICVDVDDADEVRAPRWLEMAALGSSYRSENRCGCCVDIWDVLGSSRRSARSRRTSWQQVPGPTPADRRAAGRRPGAASHFRHEVGADT